MDLSFLKEWLVPVSTTVGIFSTAAAVFTGLRDYRLKLRAETRLAEAAKVESDIKLLKLLTEIMDIAHARGSSILMSDKLFEAIWPHMHKVGHTNAKDVAIVTMPVGIACQDAAIAAIATLGLEHPVLRQSALHGLIELAKIRPNIVNPLLEKFRNRV